MKAVAQGCLAGVLALSLSPPVLAQEAKSVPLAKQLAAALDAGRLDSIAAKDPSSADVFIGALYIRGVQLLVVSARYTVPVLLNDRLAKKEYRDVYLDLIGASVPAQRVESEGEHGVGEHAGARQPPFLGAGRLRGGPPIEQLVAEDMARRAQDRLPGHVDRLPQVRSFSFHYRCVLASGRPL